jgi:uncharacterized protein (TIGR03437 family)
MRRWLVPVFFLSISFVGFSINSLNGQIRPQTHVIEMNGRLVTYVIDGPYAVTEGDVIIGTADEVENWRTSMEAGRSGPAPRSVHQTFGSTGPQIWPNGIMYYVIDPSVTNTKPLLDGIAQWNSMTPLQVVPRTDQPNYVHFTAVSIDAACESYVGMIGGPQDIGVTGACTAGSYAHEIGHAFGLLHEQQRMDRNNYVTVLYGNIDKRFVSNYYQSTSSAASGYYDFGSIMHYPYYGFSTNYQDSIESVPVGISIGQRTRLSAGDIDGVSRLYGYVPSVTTITTVPEGLPIIVDGTSATSPQSYPWPAGSQHTIEVAAAPGTDPRYVFATWSDGGGAAHTVTASADQTVFCANFVVQHLVQASASGSGGSVSINPAPPGGYLPERYPFQVRAVPSDGFEFVGWGGLGSISLASYGLSYSASTPVSEVVSLPRETFAASFSNQPVATVDSRPQGMSITVDGFAYLTPARFLWRAGTTHTLSVTTPQYLGNNTSRSQFLNWEDGSTGSRTVTAGTNDTTYTGVFNAQYLLTASSLGLGSVSASPASADGFYDAGTTIQLTAVMPAGNTLRYWVGDLASNQNPATLVMDQQRVVEANIGPALPFRVLSAASLTGNPNIGSTGTFVAPGELVALFASGIGPASPTFASLDSSGNFPTTLAGYQVFFDQFPAALIYVGPNQINAVVPYGVSGQTGTVVKVQPPSGSPLSSGISVAAGVPGLFTSNGYGTGQISAINQDGSINSSANPAPKGSVVVLYGTGGGAMDKSFLDGQVTGADVGHILQPVAVRFGKLPANVIYAGSAPFLVNGVFQINVVVPADLATGGDIPVQVVAGPFASPPGTTIAVQ